MSDLSIEKQENNISFRFDYTSCWSCVHKHCTRIWCTFEGVYGVYMCHDWQFDFDRTFTMHWHVYAQGFSASWMRLCIAQLYVAGSHRYFLITFDAKLNGMFDWFAGLVGVQYNKVLKEYIFVYSFPSLLLLGFIFSSLNSLNLEVRPEIKVIT